MSINVIGQNNNEWLTLRNKILTAPAVKEGQGTQEVNGNGSEYQIGGAERVNYNIHYDLPSVANGSTSFKGQFDENGNPAVVGKNFLITA